MSIVMRRSFSTYFGSVKNLNLYYLSVFGFLFLLGCSDAKKEESRTVFNYNESAGITSLDPAFARDQANIWAVNQIFAGLVQLDDNLVVNPCIAKAWHVSDSGTTYSFHLRNDVVFHEHPLFGHNLTRQVVAADFVFSLNRLLDPALASPGAWVLNHVATDSSGNSSITAAGDTILIIKLKSPFPPFLGLLTMQYCSVVPFELVNHYQKEFRVNPVGAGPFKFKLWKEGVKLILHKNEHYFETEDNIPIPFLDAVSVSFISDKQAAFLEFLKGKFDFISGIDASYKDDLLTKYGDIQPKYLGKFRISGQPYLNTEYLGILMDTTLSEVRSSPLKSKLVRQAVNYAIDKQKMITYLRNNIGTPGIYGFVPPGLPSTIENRVEGYQYNPEKAKQLLEKAGYRNGQHLPMVTISTTNSYLDLTEYIQSQLTAVGIKSRIEVNQAATHREMVAKSKISFFRGSWIADYPDAENYLALFYSPNYTPAGPNYTRFSSKQFDQWYDESKLITHDSTRFALYHKMDSLVTEEAPFVVLYYDQVLRLTQNNISGLGSNALNLLSLKKVKKPVSQNY
jgi:oligopeptide transport system substrate-binding protein